MPVRTARGVEFGGEYRSYPGFWGGFTVVPWIWAQAVAISHRNEGGGHEWRCVRMRARARMGADDESVGADELCCIGGRRRQVVPPSGVDAVAVVTSRGWGSFHMRILDTSKSGDWSRPVDAVARGHTQRVYSPHSARHADDVSWAHLPSPTPILDGAWLCLAETHATPTAPPRPLVPLPPTWRLPLQKSTAIHAGVARADVPQRGPHRAKTVGPSKGGGQQCPMNLTHSVVNIAIYMCLFACTEFEQIAGWTNKATFIFGPGTVTYPQIDFENLACGVVCDFQTDASAEAPRNSTVETYTQRRRDWMNWWQEGIQMGSLALRASRSPSAPAITNLLHLWQTCYGPPDLNLHPEQAPPCFSTFRREGSSQYIGGTHFVRGPARLITVPLRKPPVAFKAPRPPRTTAPKTSLSQLAASNRYKKANWDEQCEKARLRMARRGTENKGTERELVDKAAVKEASARFRQRNPYLLANRQHALRECKYAETHDWDACAEYHDRNVFLMQRRDAERAKAWAQAQAEAEEEAEWAALRAAFVQLHR
ncbi:hypothetical protein FB451DRAFT_1161994 [Mycena latifolia]|nr:hypothetical protein FB451DRAFT_1161994 [Mycena latifolia]